MAFSIPNPFRWFSKAFALVSRQAPSIPSGTSPLSANVARQSFGALGGYYASNHMEEIQHFEGWNYIAIHAKAIQASNAKVIVEYVDYDSDGKKTATPARHDDPVVRLLDRPNYKQSWAEFSYAIMCQISLVGRAIVWQIPNAIGQPAELWVIPLPLTQYMPPEPAFPMGSLWVTPIIASAMFSNSPLGSGGFVRIDIRDTRSFGWPHPFMPWESQSPLYAGRKIMDLSEEMDEATLSALRNGPLISQIIQVPAGTKQEEMERIEASINQNKAGVKNAGRVMVTNSDAIPIRSDRPPSEIDFVNGRDQARNQILAYHGVPPVACGMQEAGAYAAYYASMLQFIETMIQPTMKLLANIFEAWFRESFGLPNLSITIDAKSIVDPEMEIKARKDRNEEIEAMASRGVITVNQYLSHYGMPERPDGDVLIGQPPKPQEAKAGDAEPTEDDDVLPVDEGDESTTGISQPINRVAAFSLNGSH